MAVRSIRAAARRHPQVVDAFNSVVLAGLLARVAVVDGGMTGLGWLGFAALHLPLVWRRRWPVAVFWTVTAIAFATAQFGVLGPSLLIVPALALNAVARYRPRRYLWPALIPASAFITGWLWHGGPLWDAVAVTALFAIAALLGTYHQVGQAYRVAQTDRRRQQAQLADATERTRIAREIHDIVAHNLVVMVALADGAVAITSVAPERGVDMMQKVSMTGREALTEIRRLVGVLRHDNPGPAPQPGFDDIDELIDQVRAAGLRVTLHRDGVPGAWGPGAGLTVYRIVQEALTNTMKHAGPRATAEVRLRYDEASAEVEIIDDGVGNGQPSAGHGLAGMTERAVAYGGQVDAGPLPGHGWRVHARLPLP
jgi:signal transduction histidine kinase